MPEFKRLYVALTPFRVLAREAVEDIVHWVIHADRILRCLYGIKLCLRHWDLLLNHDLRGSVSGYRRVCGNRLKDRSVVCDNTWVASSVA